MAFEHFNQVQFFAFCSDDFRVDIKHEPSGAELLGNDFREVFKRFLDFRLLFGPVIF
jgi:hypothetical protein